MRLVQYREAGGHRAVAAIEDEQPPAEARRLQDVENSYELALEALEIGKSLLETVWAHGTDAVVDLNRVAREGRLLPPLEHPVPTRCWLSGVDSGRCWFFRGNGASLVGSSQNLALPDFATGMKPRPALVGLYLIGDDGAPCRLGWALGNDLTDELLSDQDPGQRAQAKLRATAIGPELWPGELPPDLRGTVRIRRGSQLVHEAPFQAGEAQLGHSIDALEADLFRYPMFRRPGDVHLYLFVPATEPAPQPLQAGDVCEIAASPFALPLTNPMAAVAWKAPGVRTL